MTPEVVLLLTPFKAPRALPAGVKVFDTTQGVSYSHKHLTPLFGVATTPLFLQCIKTRKKPVHQIYIYINSINRNKIRSIVRNGYNVRFCHLWLVLCYYGINIFIVEAR